MSELLSKFRQKLDRLEGSVLAMKVKRITALPAFPRAYALFGAAVLLLSSLLWSLLGARLQQSNADQLANPFSFTDAHTLAGAQLPGQHTFLIKWPLFYLVKLFDFAPSAYIGLTIISVILTVAALAWLIYRVNKNYLLLGTLFLGLSSVLLMVPAQPYAGALLPVNMAMLATRNLEYVLFIAAALMFIGSSSLRSRKVWVGVGLLALLIASDKLFLTLTLGGGLIGLLVYSLRGVWDLAAFFSRWLAGSLTAAVAAMVLLWALASAHVAQITNQATAGPYGLVHNLHDLVLGLFYGMTGLFTNFGANPAYDSLVIRNIPHQALTRLISPAGLPMLINLAVALIGIYAVIKLTASSLSKKNLKNTATEQSKIALVFIWTSLAAFIVFVSTHHYFAVDARYLTICVFALFISLAVFYKDKVFSTRQLLMAGGVIFIGLILGLVALVSNYNKSAAALDGINDRNETVASVIKHHRVSALVGDYWRVTAIKSLNPDNTNILPLGDCTQPRAIWASSAWQHDISNHSFAYLLSLDKGLTDFPQCSINQVISAYGRPNASSLIAGSLSKPAELLLFYDKSINKSAPTLVTTSQSTVLPIGFDELPNTSCQTFSVMSVVAHEDDDILFMNPDLAHDIQAGHCVRTVYVTAGDAGAGRYYWLSREQAAKAAYSRMLGDNNILWIDRLVHVNSHEFIQISNPRGNPSVSLIFLHFPDGNLRGTGFAGDGFQSIAKLSGRAITQISTVDGQSTYSYDDFVGALVSLMHVYQPAEIRTQSGVTTKQLPDHSDHMTVGQFTKQAYQTYEAQQYNNVVTIPLVFYIAYPIQNMPENLSASDIQLKESAWDAYNDYDSHVCQTLVKCMHTNYGAFLKRQYKTNF